jgi:hypothetical protein
METRKSGGSRKMKTLTPGGVMKVEKGVESPLPVCKPWTRSEVFLGLS